jgi:glycosyltransferase involved in cell wall biosynthesis
MKYNILFIGSFLGKNKGTKGIAEKIEERLSDRFNIILSSTKINQILRFLDIIKDTIFKNYDFIHIDVYSGKAQIYANIASFIAKKRKKRVIFNLRGGKLSEVYENNPNKMNFLDRAYIIISPSQFLIEFFSKKKIKINYLPNYIDNDIFPYNRDKPKLYSLLWVRAFNDIYQPELAVKIVNVLKENYPNIHLTMIGPDKGFQEKTEELISSLNLEKYISIIGKISNEELYKYYQTHQIYLNTTLYESFGSAVLEAASCGIPIVSTNVGELPYIWKDGEEILLCDSNAEEFAKNITNIFQSQELETSLSLNARKKSEEFDWKNIKQKWEKLFV